MGALGALGGQLVLFAVSLLLMQAALRWGRSQGLFAALPWGMLPALVIACMAFVQLQQAEDPEVKEAKAAYVAQVEHLATQAFPKPDESAQRDSFRELWSHFFEVAPAIEFSIHLAVLASLAVMLRRRYARAGTLPPAGPLSRWTAPWPLAWLVLGPVFVLVAQAKGALDLPGPWGLFAWNVLVVGLFIFLFQGMVVASAKLRSWWQDPRTRALVFLVLAGVFTSLLIQDGRGLLVFLLLTGLFEPWMDVRRLQQPKEGSGDQA